ncbi:hypothetical protein [Methylobacterium oryzihabitans]|uniref:Uncharacterized protein n=1 Tax=Methylobacterium oryzihabitans TaxID=2499852 RepID=A0A3S2VQN4_9HYPH|nr:hypothetical protein [Methylobacterium oryzihabitans]RVU18454.1 hypothetical protein EOE48_11235 [Methylobacterium oryzihabitans]
MHDQARYNLALANLQRELNAEAADDNLLRNKPNPVSNLSSGGTHAINFHLNNHAHAAIEITHHFLMGVAPFEVVAAKLCAPANDLKPQISAMACPERETAMSESIKSFEAIKYLPGPLQQAAIQLFTSLAISCAPVIAQWRESRSQERPVSELYQDNLRHALASTLQSKAPEIGKDVALAGLSDLAVEVVGWLMRESHTIFCRLMRAFRHAMFPTLKAIKILLLKEKGMTRRESADLALKLFVQAGIIGACIAAEHNLHHSLGRIFGSYSGIVSTICMSVLCWYICEQAITALNKADLMGVKRERDITAKIAALRTQWADGDQRVNALLAQVRASPR